MIGKKRSLFEETIEAPAKILESSFENSQKVIKKIPSKAFSPYKHARDYWFTLGPGLTTGASDDDPSGIASYSQAGAQYGLGLLWMAAFTFPLMAIVQEMCARIGLVTGRGLAGNIRKHFGKKVLYFSTILLFAANTFNIGADIGAMAKAIQLLAPRLNFSLLTISFSVLILLLQVLTPYVKYAKYLKWLALVLFVYIASAILAHPNWGDIAHHSIVPHITFSKNQVLIICALLGTTITPYLFFWQTSQEIEEEIAAGDNTIAKRSGSSKSQIKLMRVDVWSGMFISNLVMFFIIAACGSILFPHGITNITSAAQAAQALKPFAGNATYLLFAVGIIGTGLLAIPVMAGASAYAVSESIGKRQGLNSKLKQASAFYGIIIISMLIGLGLNFIGIDPIKALIYSAVGNGIVAPVILILIVLIARSEKIMGEWKNGKFSSLIAWILTFLMTASGVAVIYTLF